MNDVQVMTELNRTKSLCEQMDSLFSTASQQGRMLSFNETMRTDELSQELIKQIRRLPRRLSSQGSSVQMKVKAGETLDLVRLTLRKIASPVIPDQQPRAASRRMAAYSF